METVLLFSEVYKEFPSSEAPALRGVSFSVKAGELTALAGPSGSGKTTALNLAAGLDAPSAGRITLLGHDLSQLSMGEITQLRRESVGFVFQAYNLFPVLSALENVEYPLALKQVAPKVRRSLAREMLNEVGLSGLENRRPTALSGGQQQRVAIARAMVTSPRIVFADEPTANVDSVTAEGLLALFTRLNRDHHTTFLFSSHDPMVLGTAERIIGLKDGRITSDALRTTPRREAVLEREISVGPRGNGRGAVPFPIEHPRD